MGGIIKALFLFAGLTMLTMCASMCGTTPKTEPVTRVSNLSEREVTLKSITVKGKEIRIGMTSDQVVAILPKSSVMDQAIQNGQVRKNYYHGDKYFTLVFVRTDGPYIVSEILETRR